jgi:hypothetical protein
MVQFEDWADSSEEYLEYDRDQVILPGNAG